MTALVQHDLIDPDSPDWQQNALCRLLTTVTSGDFYYEHRFNGDTPERRKHEARLRSICEQCPVRESCDATADKNHEPGFWAGLTEHERHLRTKRRQHTARRARRTREAQREPMILEAP